MHGGADVNLRGMFSIFVASKNAFIASKVHFITETYNSNVHGNEKSVAR